MTASPPPVLPYERLAAGIARLAVRGTRASAPIWWRRPSAPGSGLPRVLFGCSHNAGRSQLATALLAHRTAGQVIASSAGTRPAAEVEPAVAAVSLTGAFPKPLTDEVVQAADIVTTMGCGDASPVLPGRRYPDWPVTELPACLPSA